MGRRLASIGAVCDETPYSRRVTDADFAGLWATLPATTRKNLRTDSPARLTVRDIASLLGAGASPTSAYWNDAGPGAADRWTVTPEFHAFITSLPEADPEPAEARPPAPEPFTD